MCFYCIDRIWYNLSADLKKGGYKLKITPRDVIHRSVAHITSKNCDKFWTHEILRLKSTMKWLEPRLEFKFRLL